MSKARTQKPVLRPQTCGVCSGSCPTLALSDLAAQNDTKRGILARHTTDGTPLPPCRAACPLGQDIPAYLERLTVGDAAGALAVILRDNPLPAVLGHVCHHPCQAACAAAPLQRPPALRELKRFAAQAQRVRVRAGQRLEPAGLDTLRAQHDAVVLACSAPHARRADLPGVDLAGVH